MKYGVSPAFIVSQFGQEFTADQFCEGLDLAKRLGFSCYQPELFVPAHLNEWMHGGGVKVSDHAGALGLTASQFVGHFMLTNFSSPQRLAQKEDLDTLKKVIECVRNFDECKVLTIPVGPFTIPWGASDVSLIHGIEDLLLKKLNSYLGLVTDAGLKLALEVLPNSVVGGTLGFLRLSDLLNNPNFGINWDTGHAHACREIVPLLPFQLGNRIFGTHICDNNSNENLSLPPGQGTLEWKPIVENLFASGYAGSLDLEIGCAGDAVEEQYLNGLKYLKTRFQ